MIIKFFLTLYDNQIIRLVIVGVMLDCLFGTIRSFKEHKPNSAIGINGVIRKVSMLASMLLLPIVDYLTGFNLIGILPDELLEYIPLTTIGITEFFGLLFIMYEAVSVLKNMDLCGLPVHAVWIRVDSFLRKYTDELPDNEMSTEEAVRSILAIMSDNAAEPDGTKEPEAEPEAHFYNDDID